MFVQGKRYQKSVSQTYTEVKNQKASYSWFLLRKNAITKVWLLILELKMQKLSYNGFF